MKSNPTCPSTAQTLVALLRRRAERQPHRRAYTFLADGETETDCLTYAALDRRARMIGAWLQQRQAEGRRVLLLYPPGLEFLAAFFGCLYAGAVAVPAAYSLHIRRAQRRLQMIAQDAQATIGLTDASLLAKFNRPASASPETAAWQLHWLATDTLAPDRLAAWQEPASDGDALAMLQYTSGSTAAPKGVMLSHRNLLHNLAFIRDRFEVTPEDCGVIWLPPYHDMGLIGGYLQPLYGGFPVTLMDPFDFAQRPIRWLQAISRYRGTISGGPNFAYRHCLHKISPEQQAGLDLSSWRVAFVGAEPVRYPILDQFAAAFESCGFQRRAFYPCYGLAEATLMVTGGAATTVPVTHTVSRTALQSGRVSPASMLDADRQTLVGCGRPAGDQRMVIVDPETKTVCPPHQVGEIWVAGSSIAQGYWDQPATTQQTFQACLAAGPAAPPQPAGVGPFLRTGDLGFLERDELFITGRLKDLIIIDGANHYPQDLELTAEAGHPALQPGGSAAFSISQTDREQVVLVCELKRRCRRADQAEVRAAVRQAVAQEHGLAVDTVVLIKPAGLPRTPSGKVQRRLCRAKFLDDALPVLPGDSRRTGAGSPAAPGPAASEPPPAPAGPERRPEPARPAVTPAALIDQIAPVLGLAPAAISPDQPLNGLALDSLKAAELKVLLDRRYGLELTPDQFAGGLTVAELAGRLQAGLEPPGAPESNGRAETPAGAAPESVLAKARAFDRPDRIRRLGVALPYFRTLTQNEGPTCLFEGRRVLMFGSNNYLGLTVDPRVRQAVAQAAVTDGPSLTGSRLLNGSTTRHQALEEKLAAFLGREEALIFTTGYQANIGLLSALMTGETTLLIDQHCHASIYDGAAVGRCKIVPFRHNDPADLEQKIKEMAGRSPALVIVDGVYSMEGDLAPLPALKAICRRYALPLAVDDAHGLGMLGATGRGVEEEFGMSGAADILSGTFSKSLASIGGWVAAEAKVIEWIRFHGRSMLFSAASPPPALAAAAAALDILMAEPWRVQRLTENAAYWRTGLQALGFDTGASTTAIVPVLIGDDLKCLQTSQALLEAGLYVNAALYPAVPRDSALLRTSVMATHDRPHLDQALEIFAGVGRQLDLI